eukprot:CAMPEP_0116003978 /NCGR_PEP_ID=MMETSP0321-20121206/342_1 /TAXON_ID=163516 /ORGANISM="Leptocylindrus danicus var. danicus, Strain B650" /LENGTH=411 /DNA_ID=CAMNT_0003472219 /DNA_START=94 /DNA_END=1329 /DNA_ORIENTATION=+
MVFTGGAVKSMFGRDGVRLKEHDGNFGANLSKKGKDLAAFACSLAIAFNANIGVVDASVAPLADVGLREFLVKDGSELLRLSLPTSLPQSNDPEMSKDVGKAIQECIELVRLRLEQVGFSGKTQVWNASLKESNTAKSLLPKLQAGSPDMKSDLEVKLDKLNEALRKQDITSTLKFQEEASDAIGKIRLQSLPQNVLPFSVPSEYANLPQLRGRASVECVISKKAGKQFRLEDGSGTDKVTLELIIDGYHAPLTAGNFVDLTKRGFYDKMPLKENGELLVESQDIDFTDPKSKEARRIPLELFYKKDVKPTYEYTSDDDMRATEGFSLPFQAYGALGMEHDAEDVNTASSKFWFLRWDQALVSPGRNTLDGSHSCFGYVVKNQDILKQVSNGDMIESMKVVEGIDKLYVPK